MILRRARGPALLAISAVFSLAGCGVHITGKAADPTSSGTSAAPNPSSGTPAAPPAAASPSGGTSATPATAASPSGGDLETACQAVVGASTATINEVFDHPNDNAGAAPVYAKGAKAVRAAGAGTPIEAQANQVAMAFESISAELAGGVDDGGGRQLAPSLQAVADACGIR